MENYKKEKSSKQHLKIDLGPDQSQVRVITAGPGYQLVDLQLANAGGRL